MIPAARLACGPSRRGLLALLGGSAVLALLARRALAQPEPDVGELRIKAAFIYKFAGYVTWPVSAFASEADPFVLGVQGSPAMLAELTQVAGGRLLLERRVVVRAIRAGEPLAGVHLLFVARQEPRAPSLQHPLLVVTEAEGEMPQGSVINFRLQDQRVRFEISLETAERVGLRLSSRLLSVALKVHAGQGG